MIKLSEIIPRFPEDGDQILLLSRTFIYSKEKNAWTHVVEQSLENVDNYLIIIYGTMMIAFDRNEVLWDEVRDIIE